MSCTDTTVEAKKGGSGLVPPDGDASADSPSLDGGSLFSDSTGGRHDLQAGARDLPGEAEEDSGPPPVEACAETSRAAGCPCEQGSDCASTYCTATDAGKVCVEPCVETCPAGFACMPVRHPPDVVYLCLPRYAKLCQPCNQNSDCQARGDPDVSLCLDYGPAGSFCGVPCEKERRCPEGYACEELQLADGSKTEQCVMAGPRCECNTAGKAIGMSTRCEVTNQYGACAGTRVCGSEGLSDCDADTPDLEICDGVDNDCDGVIDNIHEDEPCVIENGFGVCWGRAACLDGEPVCVGDGAEPEVCDGVDNDCDGETDEELGAVGGACDDGVACTRDSCNPLGPRCVNQALDERCDDGNPCTTDRCDAETGCQTTALDDVPCDDGLDCTVGDTCAAGECAGTPVGECCARDSDCDDGNQCTVDRCDQATNACTHVDTGDGSSCDADNDGCTVGDACSGGTCVPGPPADCGGIDSDCEVGECRSISSSEFGCEARSRARGAPCSDGEVCTTSDQCDGAGACVPGDLRPGCCMQAADCDDANPCTVDVCEIGTGACSHEAVGDGIGCDADGDGCTVGDACRNGVCVPGAPKVCEGEGVDGLCVKIACVNKGPDLGVCEGVPVAAGLRCDDGLFCTGDGLCDGAGGCSPGAPRDCEAESEKPCMMTFCEELEGGCVEVPVADGTPCEDGVSCTIHDSCAGGLCVGGDDFVCEEQRISLLANSERFVSVTDIGTGRYATLWGNDRYANGGGLRFTGADGSREGREQTLGFGSTGLTFSARPAASLGGRLLVPRRNANHVDAFLYGRDGNREQQAALTYPQSYGAATEPLNGRVVAVSFDGGGWGVMLSSDAGGDAGKPYWMRLDAGLEGGQWVELGGALFNHEAVDACAVPGQERMWVVRNEGPDGHAPLELRDAEGTLESELLVMFSATGAARVAALTAEHAIAVISKPIYGVDDDIVAYVAGTAGEAGKPIHLASRTDGHQRQPDVATFPDGGFVLAYTDESVPGGSDVVVDIFKPTGEHPETVKTFERVASLVPHERRAGAQTSPAVATLDGGEFVVAWTEADGVVWTRRFDRQGIRAPGRHEHAANATPRGDQREARGASSPDGNVMVAYSTPLAAAGDREVVARVFDKDGAEVAPEARLHPADPRIQVLPSVAGSAQGFVTVWEDRETDGSSVGVRGRRFGTDGAPAGDVFPVEVITWDTEARPRIAARADGSFLVTWRAGVSANVIQGRLFGADGHELHAGTQIVGPGGASENHSLAAVPGGDLWTLAWQETSAMGQWLIKAVNVGNDLQPLSAPVTVADSGSALDPDVSVSPDGQALFCWHHAKGGAQRIHCRIFDAASLVPFGDPVPMDNAPPVSELSAPLTAWLGDGRFLVAWSGSIGDSDGYGVHVRAFAAGGFPQDPSRQANRTWDGDQIVRFLIPVSTTRTWVGWTAPEPEGEGTGVRFRVLDRF